MTERHPIGLSIRGARKVYPGTTALKGVDFDIRLGAVNVLVGENGAGKSTLMKVIAGVEPLTEGDILVNGERVRFRNKEDAVDHGIGIVFQELNLFPDLTVAQNIFIGRELKRFGFHVDQNTMTEKSGALLRRLEQDINPSMLLGDLRLGQQQIVEIAKALSQNARILILDEPTSALSSVEVGVLFSLIEELKAQGVGIVYISHRLEELIRIGDYITVLRDGEITGNREMTGVNLAWIVKAMIGDKSKDYSTTVTHSVGAEVFRAEDVVLPNRRGGNAVDHVSLGVNAGEIVGVYGLMGAGRTEFLECVMGLHTNSSGRYFVNGKEIRGASVADRLARGVALVPEDRKTDGLIQIMPIRDNLALSSLHEFAFSRIHLNVGKVSKRVNDYIEKLNIKVASAENPVSSLSGGNQQKVVIGKALMTRPKVLLLDEPSRGIDIAAKAEIYRTMRVLASEGIGILFVSSDVEEVMGLSDRILVMADGKIMKEFVGGADPAEVMAAATPHTVTAKRSVS